MKLFDHLANIYVSYYDCHDHVMGLDRTIIKLSFKLITAFSLGSLNTLVFVLIDLR